MSFPQLPSPIPSIIYYAWNGGGSRGRSRPPMRWMDEILAMTNLPLAELMDATQDRVRWRRIVMDVTRGPQRLDSTR